MQLERLITLLDAFYVIRKCLYIGNANNSLCVACSPGYRNVWEEKLHLGTIWTFIKISRNHKSILIVKIFLSTRESGSKWTVWVCYLGSMTNKNCDNSKKIYRMLAVVWLIMTYKTFKKLPSQDFFRLLM